MTPLDGLLVVDKPLGPTSHDVVARARQALGTRKIGHTGTLDPAASGVLPLVVGRATRLAQFLTAGEKEYLATVRFGRTTDSYDAAGAVTSDTGSIPERAAVERALAAFVGTFAQTPPAYSAKKIEGVRAYALARRNLAVAPRPVPVTVHRMELLNLTGALAEIRIVCGTGFYVRSLAHDLGQRVGTGAMLDGLVRVRAGIFTLSGAVPLDALVPDRREALLPHFRPMETLLTDLESVTLTEEGARRARHGQDVGPRDMMSPPKDLAARSSASAASSVALFGPDGRLLGIGEAGGEPGSLHPSVVVG